MFEIRHRTSGEVDSGGCSGCQFENPRLERRTPSDGFQTTLDHSFLPITQGYWAFCLQLLKLHSPMYLYQLGKIYLYRSSLHVK